MEIEARIRQFLADSFVLGDAPEVLAGDASFLENGIIDSTGVLEVILFVEESFGIKVSDDEVVPENFDSVNRLTAYIVRKQGPAAAQRAEG